MTHQYRGVIDNYSAIENDGDLVVKTVEGIDHINVNYGRGGADHSWRSALRQRLHNIFIEYFNSIGIGSRSCQYISMQDTAVD